MSAWARFVYALKPKSWPKLLVPFALGQGLGFSAGADAWFVGLLLGFLFTVCDAVFIVALNDVGDRQIDRLKRKFYPNSGSKKTIPDGILRTRTLVVIGLVAGVLALGVCLLAGPFDRALALPFGAICLFVFLAYTFPPLRLNYRGGGELLEAVGVGLLLPVFNAYLQSGTLWSNSWGFVLSGYFFLSLASATASGLSDEQSDRRGGKRTLTVLLGNAVARRFAEASAWCGVATWLTAILFGGAWELVPGVLSASYFLVQTMRCSSEANTTAYPAQKQYKLNLHRAIWSGGVLAAVGAILL